MCHEPSCDSEGSLRTAVYEHDVLCGLASQSYIPPCVQDVRDNKVEAANAAPQALRLCQMVGSTWPTLFVSMHHYADLVKLCLTCSAVQIHAGVYTMKRTLWQCFAWTTCSVHLSWHNKICQELALQYCAIALCNCHSNIICWSVQYILEQTRIQSSLVAMSLDMLKAADFECKFDIAAFARKLPLCPSHPNHGTSSTNLSCMILQLQLLIDTLLLLCCSLKLQMIGRTRSMRS